MRRKPRETEAESRARVERINRQIDEHLAELAERRRNERPIRVAQT